MQPSICLNHFSVNLNYFVKRGKQHLIIAVCVWFSSIFLFINYTTHNNSSRNSLRWPIYIVNSFNKNQIILIKVDMFTINNTPSVLYYLESISIQSSQLCLIIQHLLKMRNMPETICWVSVKTLKKKTYLFHL